MSRLTASVRAVLEYVLLGFCIIVALIYFLGAGWFWGSFPTCDRVFIIAAPMTILVATGSVFISRFPNVVLTVFCTVIAAGFVLFALIGAEGAGICSDPIKVKVDVLPFAALGLLGLRIAFLRFN